jgi:hypothetical protein
LPSTMFEINEDLIKSNTQHAMSIQLDDSLLPRIIVAQYGAHLFVACWPVSAGYERTPWTFYKGRYVFI